MFEYFSRPLGRCPGLKYVYVGYALVISLLALAVTAEAQVPQSAWQYERMLTRESQAQFGVDAPVARFAAQLHQESHWRADVCSWAKACGLAQFMPSTAEWMAEMYPRALAPADPTNPAWAIQAQIRYNDWLYRRVDAPNECDRWAMSLSAYNGGIGWLERDRRIAAAAGADRDQWFDHVEHYTTRADWAKRENRGYVIRILLNLEPRYAEAGWPGHPVCLRADRQCLRD